MKTKADYMPRFFNKAKASAWYQPDIAAALREGLEYASTHALASAEELLETGQGALAFLIDFQDDFRDRGQLPVKGTDKALLKTCLRLVCGTTKAYFTAVALSGDKHPLKHLSFDYEWIHFLTREPLDLSGHGKAAILNLVDPRQGIFKAQGFNAKGELYEIGLYRRSYDINDSIAYWYHLQNTGQGPIWVFVPHCIEGTPGANFHPLLMETLAFMYGARGIEPYIISKGQPSDSDFFGAIDPCRPNRKYALGDQQKKIMDMIRRSTRTETFGVAGDFCKYYTDLQLVNRFKGTKYVRRLSFVEDCTAYIVPNTKKVIEFNKEARQAGVKIIRHDDLFNFD